MRGQVVLFPVALVRRKSSLKYSALEEVKALVRRGRGVHFIHLSPHRFPALNTSYKLSVLSEIQTASPKIRTRVVVSISSDDSRYPTNASHGYI